MITRLLQLKLQSNIGMLSLSALLQGTVLLLVFFLSDRTYGVDGTDAMEVEMLALLLVYLIMATVMLFRERGERRARMLAQLPVSGREVWIADWCFIAIGLCVPTFFWLISILLITGMDGALPSAPNLIFWTSFFYLLAGTLVALIKAAVSRGMLGLRPRSLAYIAGAVTLLVALIALASSRGGFTWPQLYALFLVSAAGMVALDLRHHGRAESYLT